MEVPKSIKNNSDAVKNRFNHMPHHLPKIKQLGDSI